MGLSMRLFCLSLFAAALSVAALGAAPVIGPPVNQASFESPLSPTYGIAQGSMFAVFGAEMGPAELAIASAFPLTTELAGTSVQVTVGGDTVDCILVFTSAGQLAAILPSTTPLGDGEIRVTYNGETSDPQPIHVVAHGVGMFTIPQNGEGPAVVTDANFAVNTYLNSFEPGTVGIAWVTGLGARSADDTAVPQDLKDVYDIRVGVGGVDARVLYAGPSGCCAAVDQVVYEVPSLPEDVRTGCAVPLAIRVGDTISNFTSMSVSDDGPVCGDDHGLSKEQIALIHEQGFLRLLTMRAVSAFSSATTVPGAALASTAIRQNEPVVALRSWFFQSRTSLLTDQELASSIPTSRDACRVLSMRPGALSDPAPFDSGVDSAVTVFDSNQHPIFSDDRVRRAIAASIPGPADGARLESIEWETVAPRFGASYDVRGRGDFRINASYGTYVSVIDQARDDPSRIPADNIFSNLSQIDPNAHFSANVVDYYVDRNQRLGGCRLTCEDVVLDEWADFYRSRVPRPFVTHSEVNFARLHPHQDVRATFGGGNLGRIAQADPNSGLDSVFLDIQESIVRSYSIPPTETVAYTAALTGPAGAANCNVNVNNLGVALGCGHNLVGAVEVSVHAAGENGPIAAAVLPAENSQFSLSMGVANWVLGRLAPPAVPDRAAAGEIEVRISSESESIAGALVLAP